ncbi:MAG TPA: 23S rRNA (uracil(1939)-C(5))-methyltransferase RlmD [Steroidobacteraceae bacterium]|jgi:23S rRNA (uracil1939-C5)-methyltransferase|nr:23S rRNA (uracil(1939)-C(5))-methyltransferase RlmD [Steroidobacteraceae bacterium]
MRRSARERRVQYSSETGVVAALTHEGAGIVHEGKTAFVAGALPGEQIRFRRQRSHGQHDEALLEEVLSPSAERVAPRCRHFDVCGGCALQHLDGAAQLRLKEQQLRDTLTRIGRVSPQQWLTPVSGPSYGYRRRARLGVKYVERKERVLVGFRERNSNLIAAIERCEVLAPPVDGLIAPLCTLIAQLSIRTRLPQIEVATGDDAVVLVLRVLDPPSETDLELLRAFQTQHAVRIHLQSGGIDSIRPLNAAEPALSYGLPEAQLTLEFRPTDFVQINAAINQTLVSTAVDLLELDSDSRVLDLFCGLGNFSLAMARRAAQVVGVEGDSGMVERARGNAQRNGLSNVQFHSADLFADVRGAPWLAGTYSHVLLDPPRAGAREVLPAVAQLAPRRLLYVSCHPATLARDVGLLVHEHGLRLLAAGVVDMFPHTAHVESLALLAP